MVRDLIRGDSRQCFEFFLRWFPGEIGFKLRYLYYKPRLKYLGCHVRINSGVVIRGARNMIFGSNVRIGLCAQLYAGTKEGGQGFWKLEKVQH